MFRRSRCSLLVLLAFAPTVYARVAETLGPRLAVFHASAEARDKFESNPFRYVPAAYGADVVALSRDKDVVEGTLDYAAWYKSRLYLFGSQSNYEAFIAAPTRYATLDGIE